MPWHQLESHSPLPWFFLRVRGPRCISPTSRALPWAAGAVQPRVSNLPPPPHLRLKRFFGEELGNLFPRDISRQIDRNFPEGFPVRFLLVTAIPSPHPGQCEGETFAVPGSADAFLGSCLPKPSTPPSQSGIRSLREQDGEVEVARWGTGRFCSRTRRCQGPLWGRSRASYDERPGAQMRQRRLRCRSWIGHGCRSGTRF